MENVTILVNTCDKYEDVWYPFFKLLKIHWPECDDNRIVLNTETKVYDCDFLKVETFCGGSDKTWSQRLKGALEKIDSEFVLFFLDDFFLMSEVSTESLNEAVELMKSDESIGYIGLKYNKKHNFRDKSIVSPQEHFLNRDEIITDNRLNCNTALWRKDWLASLIRKHENPWEFEKYASIRSRRTDKKVMIINNINNVMAPVFDYDVEVQYGHGLTMGQWLPKNKELFDKYSIEVDFDRLGINTVYYDYIVRIKENEGNEEFWANIPKPKFNIMDFLHDLKKLPKKLKKKLIKTIRKIRSLI